MKPQTKQQVKSDTITLSVVRAYGLCQYVLGNCGMPTCHVEPYTESIMFSTMRGIDSHGLVSVLPRTAEELKSGRVKPENPIIMDQEADSTARLDGNEGPGPIIGIYAMDLAIQKAAEHGLGAVAVRNCNHFGAASFYAMRALDHDQIGIVVCNSDPRVAPYGGRTGALGTNPISYAVPAGKEDGLVFDIATSIAAAGQIAKAQRKGLPIPLGWALDSEGKPTTDPTAALAGVMMPMAAHKGYGLGILVDVLSGALAGGVCGPRMPRSKTGPRQQSFFFLSIDVASFSEPDSFKQTIDTLITDLRSTEPAEGFSEVLVPGDIERRVSTKRRADGIPFTREEWDDMMTRLDKLGFLRHQMEARFGPVAE